MIEEFEYNGKAMGTSYSIAIVCSSEALADSLYEIAKDDIISYEACFSRFLTTSELSILNKEKNKIVSEIFLEVTLKAYQLFNKTRGIFNPLVSVSRLGYNKNFVDLEDDRNINDESFYDIDFSEVIIDKKESKIILNDGQNLDYGGFLKGYLAEIIADKIRSHSPDIKGVIVNLGGDIHTKGLDKNGYKFIFNIYNPVSKDKDVTVVVYNQSLATSGTYKRSWHNLGEKIHHILDITGRKNPDNDIISVSIICNDGGESEAYTKVFLSMDPDKAIKLLGENNLSFIIIKNNGEVIKNII
ncbi:MAG: FAD:protein FMN transferase [Candidatus Paceibacterota bacterium]